MNKKVHYPNLNSLRFLAAFVVIIHHTEQIKNCKGLPNIWGNPIVEQVGKLGVDLFFVLSGFLITSLLFIEKDVAKQIAVKKFIMRRLFRIWPLYFIIMILAFFVLPHIPALKLGTPFVNVNEHLVPNILMYAFFLPHIQLVIWGPILYCAQAWSIGIEEQFYLVWPFLVKYLDIKKLVVFIFSFIGLFIVCTVVLKYLNKYVYTGADTPAKIVSHAVILFSEVLKFDCLLIGCLLAILNNHIKDKSIFTSKAFQIACYAIELILVYRANSFYGFYWEIHAVLYGFIILNLVRPETSILNIDYPVFDYLGKISYGIYMYHILIINVVITSLYKYGGDIYCYPVIFITVVIVAGLSYKYVERYFLRLKESYSVITTG